MVKIKSRNVLNVLAPLRHRHRHRIFLQSFIGIENRPQILMHNKCGRNDGISIAVFFVMWVCRKNSSHEIKSKQNRAIDGVHRLFFYQSAGSLSISITSVWSTFSIRAFAIATIDQCDLVRLFETLMFFSKTIFSRLPKNVGPLRRGYCV